MWEGYKAWAQEPRGEMQQGKRKVVGHGLPRDREHACVTTFRVLFLKNRGSDVFFMRPISGTGQGHAKQREKPVVYMGAGFRSRETCSDLWGEPHPQPCPFPLKGRERTK